MVLHHHLFTESAKGKVVLTTQEDAIVDEYFGELVRSGQGKKVSKVLEEQGGVAADTQYTFSLSLDLIVDLSSEQDPGANRDVDPSSGLSDNYILCCSKSQLKIRLSTVHTLHNY